MIDKQKKPEYLERAFERKSHPYLMYDSLYSTPNILKGCLDERSKSNIRKVAENISKKKIERVYFIGVGTSYFAGIAASYAFQEVTKVPSFAVTTLEFLNYPPPALNGKIAVIAISHSGHTKVDVDAVSRARKEGAYIVAVTDVEDSPLAKNADSVILGPGGRDYALPKTRSYTASLLKTFMLAVTIGEVKGTVESTTLFEQLNKIPELTDFILKDKEDQMITLADKYKSKRDFFIVSGGPTYADCLEAALKLEEACFVHASGLEIEEAIHGPIVSFDEDTIVIVIAPPVRSYEKITGFAKASKTIGSTVISLVREKKDNKEISKYSDVVVSVPETIDEVFSPIPYILPLQQFVYYLALKKNLNPDILRIDIPKYAQAMNIVLPPGAH